MESSTLRGKTTASNVQKGWTVLAVHLQLRAPLCRMAFHILRAPPDVCLRNGSAASHPAHLCEMKVPFRCQGLEKQRQTTITSNEATLLLQKLPAWEKHSHHTLATVSNAESCH